MEKQKRKCQECGHVQYTRIPPSKSERDFYEWAEIACRKCKSPTLDFGVTVEAKAVKS